MGRDPAITRRFLDNKQGSAVAVLRSPLQINSLERSALVDAIDRLLAAVEAGEALARAAEEATEKASMLSCEHPWPGSNAECADAGLVEMAHTPCRSCQASDAARSLRAEVARWRETVGPER